LGQLRLDEQGFLFCSVCLAAVTGLTGHFASGSSALLLASEPIALLKGWKDAVSQ